jgi:hypothetical protein
MMKRDPSLFLVIGAAAIIGLGLMVPGPARSDDGIRLAQSTGPQFSQEQVRSFAMAAVKLEGIRNKWLPQIRAAGSDEGAQSMRQQATGEMAAAIQGQGLTVDAYNAIVEAAQADPELQGQIMAIINELQ